MTLAACIFALLGFALLALSQQRHLDHVFESNKPPASNQRAQQAIGFIALGLCLTACITTHGASFGSLLWVMLMCAAALAVALTLTWRPGWLRGLRSLLYLCYLCYLCYLLVPPRHGTSARFFNPVKGKLP